MKRTLLFYLAFLSTLPLLAQEGQSFSLQQAIQYAFAHQATVLNSVIDEEISKKKVNELVGLGTPQIEASAELNNFLEIPVSFVPGEFFGGEPGSFLPVQFGQQFTASAGVNVSQLLFDGSYLVGLQASRTYAELSRKQTKQTRTESAIAVSKAYYGALVSDARMELIEANVERVKKLLDETRVLYENGFVEKIDVDRIELTYNNLLVEKDKVSRFKAISYALLKFQMGYPAREAIVLSDKLEESTVNNITLPDSVNYSNRPEYEVLNVSRQLQELDVKRYKSTYLPSLVAFGTFSYNNARSDFDIFDNGLKWFPTAIIGARINIPIWDGLQKSARVSQAKLGLKKVDNALDLMKNSFSIELESARANYQNNFSSLVLTRKNRELATEISRVSKIKYDNGVGSGLELVNAESDLREADANYFNALYETIISRIDLDKASGNLTY
jgi:outer membrane protein TolC